MQGGGAEFWFVSLDSEDRVFPPMLAGPCLLALAKVEEDICEDFSQPRGSLCHLVPGSRVACCLSSLS